MWTEFSNFLYVCFTGASLPASTLLVAALLYWLLSVLAGLDIDFLDFDLDVDGSPDVDATLSVGLVVLRFLNIGRVPLVVWGSLFAVTFWLVSMLLNRWMDDPATRLEWWYVAQFVLRNVVVSALLTKVFTQPLRDKFEPVEPNTAQDLIGRQCMITTSEVTATFGQGQVQAEGAPLLLDIRTQEGSLPKGSHATIVGFDPEKNVYFVTKANAEV